MAALQEIDKAIGAHNVWKLRLKTAIETGRIGTPMPGLHEYECAFGSWLLGPTIAPATRASAHYAKVAELHTQFHEAAVKVKKLAESGETAQATEEITGAGEFSKKHRELAAAMQEWKTALR